MKELTKAEGSSANAPPYSTSDPNVILLAAPPTADSENLSQVDDEVPPPPFSRIPLQNQLSDLDIGSSSSNGASSSSHSQPQPQCHSTRRESSQSYPSSAEEKLALERAAKAAEFSHLDNLNNGFASVGFIQRDILRLSKFPPDVLVPANQAIGGFWKEGISKHTECVGSWEWRLNGKPWGRHGDSSVPVRQLFLRLLDALSRCGWHNIGEINLSHKAGARDTVIFKRGEPRDRTWFAVCFHGWDKVRLVDCSSVQVEKEFEKALQKWPHGIQESILVNNQRLIKLKGRPWMSLFPSEDVILGRLLILDMLAAFDQVGFELVGSMVLAVGSDNDHKEHDTWFMASKS